MGKNKEKQKQKNSNDVINDINRILENKLKAIKECIKKYVNEKKIEKIIIAGPPSKDLEKFKEEIEKEIEKEHPGIEVKTTILGLYESEYPIKELKTHEGNRIGKEDAKKIVNHLLGIFRKIVGREESKVTLDIQKIPNLCTDKTDKIKYSKEFLNALKTLEEKIVCHADNLIDNAKRQNIEQEVERALIDGNNEYATRLVCLHKELSDICGIDVNKI